MIRLVLVILLIVTFHCSLRWILRRLNPKVHTSLKKGGIVIILVIAVLLLSAQLSWIIPLLGALLAAIYRLYPYLLRYSLFFQRLWHHSRHSTTNTNQKPNSKVMLMERREALEILGLNLGASKTEIVAAHRRLIQKFHPDRGGSDYLASRINQAKDTLLE